MSVINPIVMNKWSKIKENCFKNTSEDKFRKKSDSDEQVIKDQKNNLPTNTSEKEFSDISDSEEDLLKKEIKNTWENPNNDDTGRIKNLVIKSSFKNKSKEAQKWGHQLRRAWQEWDYSEKRKVSAPKSCILEMIPKGRNTSTSSTLPMQLWMS